MSVNKLHMIGKLEDNYLLDQPEHYGQLQFFQHATGITDKRRLRNHIISIAKEAYSVFPYPCIWALYFCYTRVLTHPAYQQVLEQSLRDSEQGRQPIFLDVGSFIGIDLRQAVYSGMKRENVIGTDLIDDWARLGDKLFYEQNGIPFVKGNIFDSDFLNPNLSKKREHPIDLYSIKCLSELTGCVRFITCNSVFHLFDEEQQFELAKRLASLLDQSQSGSVIFGSHVGSGNRCVIEHTGERGMFTHSPESWKAMWEQIYDPMQARIEVFLGPPEKVTHLLGVGEMTMLFWSITIL